MRNVRRPAAVIAALLAVGASAAAASGKNVRTGGDLAGQRYCEYLAVRSTPAGLVADVWNTYGLNKCPERQWRASNPAALAKQLGALVVSLNGPRYWLMDRIDFTLPRGFGQVRTFPGGIRMRRLTTVQVPSHDGVPGNRPYSETIVNRRDVFTWRRGRRVYELVSPGGKVYVMQSYAQIVDSHLKASELGGLGARLKLPAGWRYRTRRLDRDLALGASGRAVVLQDNLDDTYQLLG